MTAGRDVPERSAGGLAVAAIAGALAMAASLLWPWISVGVGGDVASYSGLDFPFVTVFCLVLSVAIVILAIAWWWRDEARIAMLIMVAALFSTLAAVALLLVSELVAGLVPVPPLLDGSEVSMDLVYPGIGLWVGLGGSATVVLAASRPFVRSLRPDLEFGLERRGALATVFVLLSLFVLVAWMRYEPWLVSSVLGDSLALPGSTIPFIGVATLFALALMAVALVLSMVSKTQLAGLVAAASGWLVSFAAALTVVTGQVLARFEIRGLDFTDATTVTFHTGAAAWIAFASGMGVAAVGAFLVCCESVLKTGQ